MRVHMDYECYSSDHILWIAVIGIPNIVVWIIGAPIIAFVTLFKNRDNLEEDKTKMYLLILYQGLTRKVYYWEFLNTIRKVLLLSFYSILSFVSITYRVLLCLVLLVVMLRAQQRLKPYKTDTNNELEVKAIVAGTLTLFCGLLFIQDDESPSGFNILALILLIVYNALFLIEWGFYFLASFNSKNEKFVTFLKLYAMVICKKYKQEDESQEMPMFNTNVMNQSGIMPKRHKKAKMVKRRARKHIIKGQANPNKKKELSVISGQQHFNESGMAEQELSDTIRENINVKNSKINKRKLSSSSKHQEKSSELNIVDAKSKSGFARNHRQEIGLIWLDHQSSSDSN